MFVFAVCLFLTVREVQHSGGTNLSGVFLVIMGAVGALAITIIAIGIVVLYMTSGYHADWLVRLLSLANETWPNALDRYIRWQVAWNLILANPLRLSFVNFTAMQYTNYYGYVQHAAPHNIYIQAAASLTPFSPFMILFLLLRFIRFGFRTASKLPDQLKGRVLALTSFVAGAFFSNFITDKFFNYQYSLIVWLSISLVLALATLNDSKPEPSIGN